MESKINRVGNANGKALVGHGHWMCLEHIKQTEGLGIYSQRSYSVGPFASAADFWNEKLNVESFRHVVGAAIESGALLVAKTEHEATNVERGRDLEFAREEEVKVVCPESR
jgi:hypothetical protein